LDVFTGLVTLALTKDFFLIFEAETHSPYLKYVLPRPSVAVRSLSYLVAGRDFVFDIFFPYKGRTVLLRVGTTSRRGRDEWIACLGPEKRRPPPPVCFLSRSLSHTPFFFPFIYFRIYTRTTRSLFLSYF
jgi:hypothetical protein